MIIICWITCILLINATLTVIVWNLLNEHKRREIFLSAKNSFLKISQLLGFSPGKQKLPVELYIWETTDDDDVCDECFERSTWPPMDIADWMKIGMPGTPEADTECGEDCHCQLVIYKPGRFTKKQQQKGF